MTELLAFETAPVDSLCSCVGVELTKDQERFMDLWPEKSGAIVISAMKKGQQRHTDGECAMCNATGLKPVVSG